MAYIFIVAIIITIIWYYQKENSKVDAIKRNGIKAEGLIIQNEEAQDYREQLGGNLNDPTIKFFTNEGEEIIGKAVIGFTSQKEVVVPSRVYVIYNPKNPQQFCLDMDYS